MIYQKTTLLSFLGLISLSTSNYASALTTKRDNTPGVYACTESYFAGDCYHSVAPIGTECHTAQHNIISFGPDKGITCQIFQNYNCDPTNIKIGAISYPGSNDILQDPRNVGGNEKFAGSWQCAYQ